MFSSNLVTFLTDTFNILLESRKIPDMFKSGVVTPVLKKPKDPTNLDNYRGITVTPIGKLVESILLPRLEIYLNQSNMQFGFTQNLSPVMAALIITETRAEAKLNTGTSLFLLTLDSQKAFDVVNHTIMLDKLYEMNVNPTLWLLIKDLYTGLSSKVKWLGQTSSSFSIKQGVRQGGILSPFLYKAYINPCLLELERNRIGYHIGTSYTGCPTCADDLALLSDNILELQIMTDIVNRHAKQDRVTIHPEKSNAVVLSKSSSFKRDSFMLNLDDRNIPLVPNTTHLGILRAETNENIANIDERLKLARRTLYSLIGTGVHGSNGINPKVSYKIYQCYVIPRMLYGLEVIPINDSQMENLLKFHLQSLKRIQSLPKRTANFAVYLLLGALPLQAELHKPQLGLLYNIIFTQNETLASLTHRQCAIN